MIILILVAFGLSAENENWLRIPPKAERKKLDIPHLRMNCFAIPNRRLLDRAVIFDFVRPFDLIPKYREKCEASPAVGGASKQPIASDFEKSFIWSELLDEGRTFFERRTAP